MIEPRAVCTALACVALLAGCGTVSNRPAASRDTPVDPAPSSGAAPPASTIGSAEDSTGSGQGKVAENPGVIASTDLPPCLPADSKTNPAPKRKPRAVAHSAPAPAPEPLPASAPPLPSEAAIKPLAVSSASILGKQVVGSTGDDLGRVVDVLADAGGHVQIAIIEVGGFLGLGNRRIAVDWALLKFHPEDPQGMVSLNVSKRRLQSAPEYRDSAHPFALMAPAAPDPVAEGKK